MTIGNAKSWSDFPLATAIPTTATLLALIGGAVYQVTPAQFLAISLPQQGNFYAQIPANVTVPLISYAEYPFTINTINYLRVTSGTINLSIQIGGANVTGLSNITVTTTAQNLTATAANTVAVGARVTLVLSANAASAGLEFTMKGTPTA